jgi:hypothetical protein
MFSEPGFWIMTAGALLVAAAFVGLAFSRIADNDVVHSANVEGGQAPLPMELSDPFVAERKTEVAKPFGRAGLKRAG